MTAGCNRQAANSNNNQLPNNPPSNEPDNPPSDNTPDNNTITPSYNRFILEIKLNTTHELEIEYTPSAISEMKVEIVENGRQITELKGDPAKSYIEPLLAQLEIDSAMSRSEVIDRILTVFGWSREYNYFELDALFSDGTTITIDN